MAFTWQWVLCLPSQAHRKEFLCLTGGEAHLLPAGYKQAIMYLITTGNYAPDCWETCFRKKFTLKGAVVRESLRPGLFELLNHPEVTLNRPFLICDHVFYYCSGHFESLLTDQTAH